MNKKILFASIVGSLLLALDLFILESGFCSSSDLCAFYAHELLSTATGYLTFFVATLLLSIALYIFRVQASMGLIVFTVFWVVIAVMLSYKFGQASGGWITSSPEPQGVFFMLMIPYLFISLGFVLYSRFTRKA